VVVIGIRTIGIFFLIGSSATILKKRKKRKEKEKGEKRKEEKRDFQFDVFKNRFCPPRCWSLVWNARMLLFGFLGQSIHAPTRLERTHAVFWVSRSINPCCHDDDDDD
jgi:hypothetical protein